MSKIDIPYYINKEADVVDFKDKIIFIKFKRESTQIVGWRETIKTLAKTIREKTGATVIVMPDNNDISVESMKLDDAINYINGIIEELHGLKESLVEKTEEES